MLPSRARPPSGTEAIDAISEQQIRTSKQHLASQAHRPQTPQFKECPKLCRKPATRKKSQQCHELDSPTTSEFVSTPSLQKCAFSRPLRGIAAWPGHLQDEIVAPPVAACSMRDAGIVIIADLFNAFVVPEEQDIPSPNACICAAIRIFDASLASSASSLMEWKRNPMLAGACLMIATKLLEVHPSPSWMCLP